MSVSPTPIRWKTADAVGGQGRLFAAEDVVERHVGRGEFRGLEFLHVNARRIINEVPAASRLPFRYTINAYRGCSHACVYCLAGSTPVLLGDGRTRPIADLREGDEVYGTERVGRYRRLLRTRVLAHWSTVKPAWRVTLEGGTELVASGDHRFLSDGGWRYVTGAEQGSGRRPWLTTSDQLIGTGAFADGPAVGDDYRAGYLCGRGHTHLGSYRYARPGSALSTVHPFRLALFDLEPLRRARSYLADLDVATNELVLHQAAGAPRPPSAIRTSTSAAIAAIGPMIDLPERPTAEWSKGLLAGIFDAEGGYSGGVPEIASCDDEIFGRTANALGQLGFLHAIESRDREKPLEPIRYVRLLGGLREHLRFLHTVEPATTPKRHIEGRVVSTGAQLRVRSIERAGDAVPMFDITTGTGDFIANGVVSHNCFARPTHEYLGLGAGADFDTKIVVKVNAVERLRAELKSSRWAGDHIAMGTNTDPYQRCEGKYHLTRGIVAVLADAANPFSILTKSTLVLRDLDVLAEATRKAPVRVNFSIGTLDEDVWRRTEPGTPHPARRVEAVRRLNDAGIPCGVLVAPVLPGLSDAPEHLEAVVRACAAAGAVSISAIGLHLRPGVREHFLAWLERERPDLVPPYERRYRRAYLPATDQKALAAEVAGLVERALGRFVPPVATRDERPRPEPAPPATPPSEQLALPL